MVRVSPCAARLPGTSAQLVLNKYLAIYDLLYATMLPSGNDAAHLLAQIFGLLLFYEAVKTEDKDYSEIESIDLTCYEDTSEFVCRFIAEMNAKAKRLKMHRTNFHNAHGLSDHLNVSTAKDIATLCRHVCLDPYFKDIVKCKEYTAELYEEDLITVYAQRKWVNTNKLLDHGWEGIKTGNTAPAGACLASLKNGVYIVVLNCQTRDARFQDTATLYHSYTTRF